MGYRRDWSDDREWSDSDRSDWRSAAPGNDPPFYDDEPYGGGSGGGRWAGPGRYGDVGPADLYSSGWRAEPRVERSRGRDGDSLPAGYPPDERRPVEGFYPRQRGPRPPAGWLNQPGRQAEDDDEDEDDDDRGSFFGALAATLAFDVIPILGYLGWSFLRADDPQPGCVATLGVTCVAPYEAALNTLVNVLPQIAVAVSLSMIVAMVLRWVTMGWRSLTVGFAAAVVAGGTSTVFFTAINSSG